MGRRDDDARPPIEFLGSEPGAASTQQVALGPRRPKPGRRRHLAIAVAVVAVLGLGLLLGGRDDGDAASSEEERDNQERIDLDKPLTSTTARRPTTTTTEPNGPPFGEPIEGVLMIYTGVTWTRTDLTTGATAIVSLPPANFYDPSAVAIGGGLAVPSGSGEVWFYPALGPEEDLPHVVLGPGDRALPAGDDRLWLVHDPFVSDESLPTLSDVRLVDLEGRVLRSFNVPGSYIQEATSEDLIIERGGRVYAVDEEGLRPIAIGGPIGTVRDHVLVVTCDDRGDCALESHPTKGGPPDVLVDGVDPDRTSYQVVDGEDGAFALVELDNTGGGSRLLLFDGSGEPVDSPDLELGQVGAVPQFLPGDLGILLFDGSYLQQVHEVDGEWRLDNVRTEPGRGVEGAVVVIP
jgi:hypothetical protein